MTLELGDGFQEVSQLRSVENTTITVRHNNVK